MPILDYPHKKYRYVDKFRAYPQSYSQLSFSHFELWIDKADNQAITYW
jgi:hypothetical protein